MAIDALGQGAGRRQRRARADLGPRRQLRPARAGHGWDPGRCWPTGQTIARTGRPARDRAAGAGRAARSSGPSPTPSWPRSSRPAGQGFGGQSGRHPPAAERLRRGRARATPPQTGQIQSLITNLDAARHRAWRPPPSSRRPGDQQPQPTIGVLAAQSAQFICAAPAARRPFDPGPQPPRWLTAGDQRRAQSAGHDQRRAGRAPAGHRRASSSNCPATTPPPTGPPCTTSSRSSRTSSSAASRAAVRTTARPPRPAPRTGATRETPATGTEPTVKRRLFINLVVFFALSVALGPLRHHLADREPAAVAHLGRRRCSRTRRASTRTSASS